MSRLRRSNPLALAVLGCLLERPMHPYEMASTMRQRAKHESIKLNYGSLYTVVESLHRWGLVEPRETVRDGRRPERTIYAITADGQRKFVDWLAELLRTPVKEFTQFEAGLSYLAGLPPAEVAQLLGERSFQLEGQIRTMRAMLQLASERAIPRLFYVEVEYKIVLLAAERDWVTSLAREIEDGSIEGYSFWLAQHEPAEQPEPVEQPEPEAPREGGGPPGT